MSDAASYFGVAVKTIRDWVNKGIISKPPQIEYGAGFLDIYPDEYIEKAKLELEKYRNNKKKR